MAYGSTHSSTLPTVGGTTGPTFAQQINAAINELRATVDELVTPAGISINANLSFLTSGSYYALTNLERANFQDKSAAINATTYPRAVYVVSGNLFYNDGAGNQVQLTSGGTVNVAGIGAITGAGYGAGSVEVNWDAGNLAYRMRSGAAADAFADVVLDDALFNDGSGNYLRLTAQAMASDYTVTFPAAVPASTLPVLMDTSGTLSTSGTLANLVAITTSSTVTANGLVTANAGVTAGANQHITVSGTGVHKHGTEVLQISAAAAIAIAGGFVWDPALANMNATAGGDTLVWALPLPVGARILTLGIIADLTGAGTRTMRLRAVDAATGTNTTVASDASGTNSGWTTYTYNPADTTLTSGNIYHVEFVAGNASDLVAGLLVSWDRP